jgi:hypothetical protein
VVEDMRCRRILLRGKLSLSRNEMGIRARVSCSQLLLQQERLGWRRVGLTAAGKKWYGVGTVTSFMYKGYVWHHAVFKGRVVVAKGTRGSLAQL